MPELSVSRTYTKPEKPEPKPSAEAWTPERPFQLDVVYVTTSQQDADRFAAYVRDNYAGFVRPEPIPNLGSGISNAIVFNYCFSKATATFMQGLYAFLSQPHSFLWVGVEGAEPRMYAGQPAARASVEAH